MNTLKYILPIAAGALLTLSACKDDDVDLGNPSMNVKTDLAEAHFGDILRFTVNAQDLNGVPLSTLKAALYFDSEKVAEEVIRTAQNGADYEGKIFIPYIANVPDGVATLRLTLQNTQFTMQEIDYHVRITHPDFPYLTLVTTVEENGEQVEKEFQMTRTSMYNYEVEQTLPQKIKAYIKAPKVGENGNELIFGYESNNIIVGGEGEIPFSNNRAGKYTVTFNTFSFEGTPFVVLKINGEELIGIDENHAQIDLNLSQGEIIRPEGFVNFSEWWIDPDYFADNDDGTLTFLPLSGNYRIIADSGKRYFRVYSITGSDPTTLADDGSGAVWIIGTNIGMPSVGANEVGWTTENALCMAPVANKVYETTVVGGKTVTTDAINFKFFGQMGWGVELTGNDYAEVNSAFIGVGMGGDSGHDSGNLYLLDGVKLGQNMIYKIRLDLTGGIHAAKLSFTEEGEQPFEEKKVFVNGTKLSTTDNALYTGNLKLAKSESLIFEGLADLGSIYVDPDYFTYDPENQVVIFNALEGDYKLTLDVVSKTLAASRTKADGSDAELADHAIWLMGWGVGSPSMDHQFGWDPGKAYCVAEVAPNVYQFTGQAGPEHGSSIGQRLRTDYLSFKFFHQNGWGGEYSGDNALTLIGDAPLYLKDAGNFELADGVQLTEGDTYRITIDVAAKTINMVKL